MKLTENLKFFSNPHPRHQQDRWVICDVFHGKRNGFFVDAGAGYDGVRSSNSYALETEFGWQGICIEANPMCYELIKENRICNIESAALWSEPTELTFTLNLKLPGTSGVPEVLQEEIRDHFYKEDVQTKDIKVKALPLADILKKHNAPKDIDYLSMDIEGAEYDAFKNFPFDYYTFKCMTIEKGSKELGKLRKLLRSKGYKLVNVIGADDFWIHSSFKYHIPFSKRLIIKILQTILFILRGPNNIKLIHRLHRLTK